MKILAFQITELNRVRLCMAVGVVNWACILLSLILIGIGAYVKISVEGFMHLVEDYDGDTFPYLMIGVGLFSLILNGGAGFLFFMSNNPKKREMLRPFYFVYIALASVVAVVILVGGGMCFAHIGHLAESFQNGLTASMDMYRNAPHKKKEIDLLQMNYQCCGSDHYEDWFSIDWVAADYRIDFDPEWYVCCYNSMLICDVHCCLGKTGKWEVRQPLLDNHTPIYLWIMKCEGAKTSA